jgi:wyosine [tRNA(Phe)-imidazoG37] synthetase (radical SAM superfamily)
MADNLEHRFTSTVAKLLKQHDRIPEWAQGKFRPISLQLAPTDNCNLKCVFCSVANRLGDELEFDSVVDCLESLVKTSYFSALANILPMVEAFDFGFTT